MLQPGAVECIARKAQKVPGRYGIFCKEAEVDDLWCYLSGYAERFDGSSLWPVGEARFANGSIVKIYDVEKKHYFTLEFHDVLYSDESLREQVEILISLKPSKGGSATDEAPPTPVFGL